MIIKHFSQFPFFPFLTVLWSVYFFFLEQDYAFYQGKRLMALQHPSHSSACDVGTKTNKNIRQMYFCTTYQVILSVKAFTIREHAVDLILLPIFFFGHLFHSVVVIDVITRRFHSWWLSCRLLFSSLCIFVTSGYSVELFQDIDDCHLIQLNVLVYLVLLRLCL